MNRIWIPGLAHRLAAGLHRAPHPPSTPEIQAIENHHDTSLSSSTSAQEAGEGADFNYDSLKDYIAYGLTYDKKEDRFLFHGKQVRLFVDKDIKNEGRSNNFYYDAKGNPISK
ncbi:hypothetical protein [Paenibacillus sp. FSL L8-0502]|uniref:hypothetical protein n=1 Tax=unclassified Paenibacillus TaxID=185978 RepID=UPI003158695F